MSFDPLAFAQRTARTALDPTMQNKAPREASRAKAELYATATAVASAVALVCGVYILPGIALYASYNVMKLSENLRSPMNNSELYAAARSSHDRAMQYFNKTQLTTKLCEGTVGFTWAVNAFVGLLDDPAPEHGPFSDEAKIGSTVSEIKSKAKNRYTINDCIRSSYFAVPHKNQRRKELMIPAAIQYAEQVFNVHLRIPAEREAVRGKVQFYATAATVGAVASFLLGGNLVLSGIALYLSYNTAAVSYNARFVMENPEEYTMDQNRSVAYRSTNLVMNLFDKEKLQRRLTNNTVGFSWAVEELLNAVNT